MQKPFEQKLSELVQVTGFCWLWTGALNSRGYGSVRVGKKKVRAHRAVYAYLVGEPPAELPANHLCKVRHCVNPDHLEFVTTRENVMYSHGPAALNARKTHCKRGHELLGSNLHVNTNGARVCRTCHRETARRNRQRKKEAA